jgi:hypothetical protein
MNWLNWLPWRFIIGRVARSHGFLDPVALLARLHRFAQPSEVDQPVELLRAGVVFHARGLINSRVIQHNLDWVWPYWIERQFDPVDPSFVPRAFSITHINLTHRNWTAIGYPDCEELPIVDPRGLLTPFLDGWSLDGWLLGEDGRCLLPSRSSQCSQRQELKDTVRIVTETRLDDMRLTSSAWVTLESGIAVCQFELTAESGQNAMVVMALRPQNPEGVSFIHEVKLDKQRDAWSVDGERLVRFSQPCTRHHVSDYHGGDVHIHLADREDQSGGSCHVGLVTAAALFPVRNGEKTRIHASIALTKAKDPPLADDAWKTMDAQYCKLSCPEPRYQFLYDAALRSLVLHSPDDVYPGPYTYKRFWFRDAAFIIHALLCAGLEDRAERALANFPRRQTVLGYFCSQEGEWDSNGQVLWIVKRYGELTGKPLRNEWREPMQAGARWILRKRLARNPDSPHAGLLPAGFSAEHLGPNDFYYWDDFWGIAGLRCATELSPSLDTEDGAGFRFAADDFEAALAQSLASCAARLGRPAMPASPYRRLDAGAIGSLAGGYPLQLLDARDPRLLDTIEFLIERCFVHGAFFQDMIHSGLNAYLTLHVAQVLLRASDPRYLELMDAVAELASPTGQWPEAIHPGTGGGCMGDGHHVWAAAEWLLMVRNCLVREEADRLVLCAGLPQRWLDAGQPIGFGPAPTAFGPVTITVTPQSGDRLRIAWQGEWRGTAPAIEIRPPGFAPVTAAVGDNSVELAKLMP